MEHARLAPRHGEGATAEIAERALLVMVSTSDADRGLLAREGLVREGLLTSLFDDESDFDLVEQQYARSWLSHDNPFLNQEDMERLDERGLVRVGTALEVSDVLASVLRTALPKRGQRRQEGKCRVVNDSWQAPPEWAGADVADVQLRGRSHLGKEVPRTVSARVRVAVRAEHVLAVGDVLLFRHQPLGVLAQLIADEKMPRYGDRQVDLIVPKRMGADLGMAAGGARQLMLGKAYPPASQAIQARAMEHYSLISKQPLLNSPHPAQLIWESHIRWLQERGLIGNIAELTSLKSDDLANRGDLLKLVNENRHDPESIPFAGAPESLLITQSYLRCLCFDARLEREGDAVAITIRHATDEDILSWSSGQVRKPETITFRDFEEVNSGLYCPEIFGTPTKPRRRRFGHVALPFPVVSPLLRTGNPSVLETVLGLPGNTIEGLLGHHLWARRSHGEWETFPAPERPGVANELTGALAIEAMLKTASREKLPADGEEPWKAFVHRVVPVAPPETRPLVLLDNGNWATADINDLYRRLLNCANRLAKLEELHAPSAVILNERREVQERYDAFLANCLLDDSQAVEREEGNGARLVDCLALLAGHILGHKNAGGRLNKRVEWCGCARAVASDAVPENQVRVPPKILDTLRLDSQTPVLLTSLESNDGAFVALLPQPHDDAVLRLPSRAFAQLRVQESIPLCVLHRPLGSAACEEARRLLEDPSLAARPLPVTTSWIDANDEHDLIRQLNHASLSGSRVVLQSSRGLLICGTGSLLFADDSDLGSQEENAQEMDLPGSL